MAGINFHPAPGNINKLPPGWLAIRRGVTGIGDIVNTMGFTVPDRSMRQASVDYTSSLGEILATQGFSVPNRDMNPVADFVSGNVKPLGQSGCGCAGKCGGNINGYGVGDISADFANIQNDFTAGNYMNILSAPIMGVPYGIPLALAAILILPGLMSGGGGRRRR